MESDKILTYIEVHTVLSHMHYVGKSEVLSCEFRRYTRQLMQNGCIHAVIILIHFYLLQYSVALGKEEVLYCQSNVLVLLLKSKDVGFFTDIRLL